MMADDGYERLRDAIVSGRLQPNQRLVEADLTRELGVGRAAVRTALVRLAHEGLVEQERNRGAKVRFVDESEAIEILEARTMLEGLAARHAARLATPADVEQLRTILSAMKERVDAGDLLGGSDQNAILHARLLEISAHRTVQRLVRSLRSQLVRFQYRTILVPGRSHKSLVEHTAIVDAIAGGDEERAEAGMRAHLAEVTEALRAPRGAPVEGSHPRTELAAPARVGGAATRTERLRDRA